jgi:hypothetical protein
MTPATEVEGATMKIRRRQRRWLVLTAFGLMAASVLVGQAQAKPDDLEQTAPYSSDGQVQPVRPDDAAVRISPGAENLGAVETRSHGVVVDDSKFTGAYTIPNVPDSTGDHRTFGGGTIETPVVVDDGTEFNWRDAGFGALGAAATLALLAALAIVIRRDRHRGGLATS